MNMLTALQITIVFRFLSIKASVNSVGDYGSITSNGRRRIRTSDEALLTTAAISADNTVVIVIDR